VVRRVQLSSGGRRGEPKNETKGNEGGGKREEEKEATIQRAGK
jgi:hypothetical protein